MEMVGVEPVTVLCGETGSGKTTQLPLHPPKWPLVGLYLSLLSVCVCVVQWRRDDSGD